LNKEKRKPVLLVENCVDFSIIYIDDETCCAVLLSGSMPIYRHYR